MRVFIHFLNWMLILMVTIMGKSSQETCVLKVKVMPSLLFIVAKSFYIPVTKTKLKHKINIKTKN